MSQKLHIRAGFVGPNAVMRTVACIALLTAAVTVQAETWRCVDPGGRSYKASQKVPSDRCKLVSKDSPYAGSVEPVIPTKPSPRPGMSQKDVLSNTSWGQPYDVHRTTTVRGVHEQWVYYGSRYLYFENGVLTTIQE
jgi:hypothetical protein